MSNHEIKCPKCGTVFTVDEAEYASIVEQVRNAEFAIELENQLQVLKESMAAEQKLLASQAEREHAEQINAKELALRDKDAEISRLMSQIEGYDNTKKAEIHAERAQKDSVIAGLKAQLERAKGDTENAVMKVEAEKNKQLQENELTIQALKNQIAQASKEAQIILNHKKEEYENDIKMKEKEIENLRYRFITGGTKKVGEELEQWCLNEFTKVRSIAYPNAYFEKDNEIIKGTKGDFVFRDYVDGVEYISIMFEMKNEIDGTSTKHKNEDFFAKLDKDRENKGCEYAVLVSMLERDSELYSDGIVDVSYRYPKMFVVRPRSFMSIIALLTKASLNSVSLKRDLEIARRQTVDVTNFESKLNEFKDSFSKRYRFATERFNDAIKEIDESIKNLQDVKKQLLTAGRHLYLANGKAVALTIRSLTYKNPTMKKLFNEARRAQGEPDDVGYAEEIVDPDDDEMEGFDEADAQNEPEMDL